MERLASNPRENHAVKDGVGGTDDGTVTLTIPANPAYLRLARLAAADTGARAGLSVGDLEDLRIAVDELAYALIRSHGSMAPITLSFQATTGAVEIEGVCARNGSPPRLSELAQKIVTVIADEHEIGEDGEKCRFRLVKRTHA